MAAPERTFSQEDIDAFAAASGDRNPIHCDPVEARRLIGGATLVHGVHALLWALGTSLREGGSRLRLASLEAAFRQPIRVGDSVSCAMTDGGAGRVGLLLRADGREVLSADVLVVPGPEPGQPRTWPKAGADECRVRAAGEVADAAGSIAVGVDAAALSALLPSLSLPADQVAALATTSRLVGMECPGRDSLLHRIQLRWEGGDGDSGRLEYRVERFDPRFSSVRMRVASAGMQGRVEAFLRPGPVLQPTAAALRERTASEEFASMRALVIGGSRGLGEVAAKLLGVGGADVRLTYRIGRADAERVRDEIQAAGGRAQVLAFDVLDEGVGLGLPDGWSPSHLFYFPTPHISLAETTRFSPRLFRLYCGFYVEGLVRTLEAALALGDADLAAFYPSTAALDEVLPKALEYAAAKAAGEVACRHLEKLHPRLRVRVSRLPRVRTDATASLLPVEAREAGEVMLAELRALREEARPHGEGVAAPR